MMSNIFDVVKPKGAWAEQYAKLEYEHIGLKMVGATKIEVSYESV